jgi:hypothetical protein
MVFALVVIGFVAFFVGSYLYDQKVIHTDGTWFEYAGEPNRDFFMSPFIRLLQDYTNSDEGNSFPFVSHAEILPNGNVERCGLLGLHNYQKVTNEGKINQLEKAYLRKIKEQKQELELNKKEERERAMEKFLA